MTRAKNVTSIGVSETHFLEPSVFFVPPAAAASPHHSQIVALYFLPLHHHNVLLQSSDRCNLIIPDRQCNQSQWRNNTCLVEYDDPCIRDYLGSHRQDSPKKNWLKAARPQSFCDKSDRAVPLWLIHSDWYIYKLWATASSWSRQQSHIVLCKTF